jgi:hypothetical protein
MATETAPVRGIWDRLTGGAPGATRHNSDVGPGTAGAINFLFFGAACFEAAGGPICAGLAIRAVLCSQADIQGSQLMGKILGW